MSLTRCLLVTPAVPADLEAREARSRRKLLFCRYVDDSWEREQETPECTCVVFGDSFVSCCFASQYQMRGWIFWFLGVSLGRPNATPSVVRRSHGRDLSTYTSRFVGAVCSAARVLWVLLCLVASSLQERNRW